MYRYRQEELDDYLLGTVIPRGLFFDTENGFAHTHNKVDSSALRPPFKFHLCTPLLRPDARMTGHDMLGMGRFLSVALLNHRPMPAAFVGVPRVGEAITSSLQIELQREGAYIPMPRLTKYKKDGVEYIGEVADRAGYAQGPVWLIDDLIHKGLSKSRSVEQLASSDYTVTHINVFLDYGQGASEYFRGKGIAVHAVTTVPYVLELGYRRGKIGNAEYAAATKYLAATKNTAAV